MKPKVLLLTWLLMCLGIGQTSAATIQVSTTEGSGAEHPFYISNKASTAYYLTPETYATLSGPTMGRFAFYSVSGLSGAYYIYSIDGGKWVSYDNSSIGSGAGKVTLVSDKSNAHYWNIAVDDANTDYYDFRPYNSDGTTVNNASWNWYNGPGYNAATTMGFYGYTDGNSGWLLTAATFDATKRYTFQQTTSGKYISFDPATTENNALKIQDTPSSFVIAQGNGGFYLYNTDGTHYVARTSWNAMPDLSSNYLWAFEVVDANAGTYRIKDVAGSGYMGTDATTAGSFIYTNKSNSIANGIFKITAVSTQNVTYTYTDGTNSIGTKTITEGIGCSPSGYIPPAYVTVSDMPGVIVSGTTAYTIPTTTPISQISDGRSTYLISLRNGGKYLTYNAEQSTVASLTTTAPSDDLSKSKAAFIVGGDWYNGYTFRNVFVNKYVTAPSANPGSGEATVLSNSNTNGFFDLVVNNSKYYFKLHGTNSNYITDYQGQSNAILKFWNSTANVGDAGSQFAFEPVNISAYSYLVTITGDVSGTASVTYGGTAYTNGALIAASGEITANDITASSLTGYTPIVTIEGNSITITYAATTVPTEPANLTTAPVYTLASGTNSTAPTTTGGNLYYNSAQPDYLCNTKAYDVTIDKTSAAQQFAFIQGYLGTYLYSIGGGKFLKGLSVGSEPFPLVSSVSLFDSHIQFLASESEAYHTTHPAIVLAGERQLHTRPDLTYGVVAWNNISGDNNSFQIVAVSTADLSSVYSSVESAELAYINTLLADAGKVGYPKTTCSTYTALLNLRNSINSSTANKANRETYLSVINAYLNETDIVLPTDGAIYSIQSVYNQYNSNAYIYDAAGTFTIAGSASETALQNLWVAEKQSEGVYYFRSAANYATPYYLSAVSGLQSSGYSLTLSIGTKSPYIALYNNDLYAANDGRYVVAGYSDDTYKFGRVNGAGYYAQSKEQHGTEWSSDFLLTENASYELYTVTINGAPTGSSPTITYGGTAYGNGSKFVAPTTLAAANITASSIADCTSEVTISGTAVTVTYTSSSSAATVTYVYSTNSYEWYRETKIVNPGEPYPDLKPEPTGITYRTIPIGTVSGTETFTVECELNINLMPLPLSAGVENANWVYISAPQRTRYFLYYNPNNQYLTYDSTSPSNTDAYKWAFVYNPFTQKLKIYNKAAGSNMILSSGDPSDDGNTGGNTFPHMVNENSIPNGYNTYWSITPTYNTAYLISRDGESIYLNKRNTKLAYWTEKYDVGSLFFIVPVVDLAPVTGQSNLKDSNGNAVSASKTYRLVNRANGSAIQLGANGFGINYGSYPKLNNIDDNDQQKWTITASGSGFNLQNTGAGTYLTGNITQNLPFWYGSGWTWMDVSTMADDPSLIYFYEADVEGDIQYYYMSSSSDISPTTNSVRDIFTTEGSVVYPWGSTFGEKAQWYIECTEASSSSYTKVSTLTNGAYYRLHSYSYPDLSMTENGGKVDGQTNQNSSYSQIWKLTRSGNNNNSTRYTLQNVFTGKYIQTSPGQSVQFSTGSSANAFYTTYDGNKQAWAFDSSNLTGWNDALHCSSSQGYTVVGWTYTSEASYWCLEKVELSSAQIAEIEQLKSLTTTDYTNNLTTFFNDYACTSLKSNYAAMSDEALRSAMSSLPTSIQDMAVRVKNNTWNSNTAFNTYEKAFRIHDYEAYSEPMVWQNKLGFGPSGRTTQSTGITVQTNDLLQIYVNDDLLDSDAHLYAELVTGVNLNGTQYALKKGYNTILATTAAELFITYNVSNTEKYIANYPNIKVHVEGGTCTGTWDMHRGHTNNDWMWMKNNMFNADYLHIKGNTTMLCCYTNRVRNATNLTEVMKIWDFVQDTQDYLMNGHYYDGRYKVMLINRDITEGNPNWGGGAANYPGIYANGLLNLDNYKYLGTDGGELWVIEHEQGHGHQNPFNIAGGTESTNNSLAQMVNHLWGYRTSRGHAQAYLAQYSNQGYSWVDYMRAMNFSGVFGGDVSGMGTWLSNHIWYQLWLYFHLQGDDEFFSRFIQAIRDRGGISKTNSNSIAAYTGTVNATSGTYSAVPAAGHYLKDYMLLALAATDAANADLYEFFKAWGFFKYAEEIVLTDGISQDAAPVYYVGDYGSNYVRMPSNTSSADRACLANIKAYMQSKTTKVPNLLFINDTQTLLPISEDAECVKYNKEIVPGTTTVQWADGSASNGQAGGDLYSASTTGIYTDYGTNKADELCYTLNTSTYVVTVSGSGAVGYKIYDASGEMVWISYGSPFTTNSTIAAGLSAGTYTLVASLGDGTELIISSNPAYDMVVYNGTQEDTQAYKTSGITADSYTSGTLNLYRQSGNLVGDFDFVTGSGDAPNALATLNADNDSNLPSALRNKTNIIYGWNGTTGTAYNIDITDKANFYAPGNFNATDVQYARTNTGGLNTVCLPFAVAANEYSTVFGNDATVYVLHSLEGSSIQFVQTTGDIAAGTPVLVNNSSTSEWSFNATTSRSMTGTAGNSTEGGGQIVGAFQKATLGAGYYKLNSAGTKFVNTTATSTITPFRFYLSATASGTRAFVLSFIDLDETITTVGAVQTEDGSLQTKDIYDLQGRRVTQPQRGHIYIIGGKKIRY